MGCTTTLRRHGENKAHLRNAATRLRTANPPAGVRALPNVTGVPII